MALGGMALSQSGTERVFAHLIGQGPDDLLHAMWRTDPVFARQVLAKTLADSFWSDKPAAYRFARLRVLKTCPLELLRPAVRRCFIHEFYRRLRPGKR